MRCPHCTTEFHAKERTTQNFYLTDDNTIHIFFIGEDKKNNWWLEKITCPACKQFIIKLISAPSATHREPYSTKMPNEPEHQTLVHPKIVNRDQ